MLEHEVHADPLRQFAAWFEAARAEGLRLPEAMAVATATPEGAPSARMVLLKEFDERGFVFYTGYESRKGRELSRNPRAALLFYWEALGRQVRIEGSVDRVSSGESRAYFSSRPLASRLSAAASRQSETVTSRAALEAKVAELAVRFASGDVPLPASWGGYRVAPASYEFWEHRDDRLHDRLRYVREEHGWRIERLQP